MSGRSDEAKYVHALKIANHASIVEIMSIMDWLNYLILVVYEI